MHTVKRYIATAVTAGVISSGMIAASAGAASATTTSSTPTSSSVEQPDRPTIRKDGFRPKGTPKDGRFAGGSSLEGRFGNPRMIDTAEPAKASPTGANRS